ncbi:hypothetical protein BV898_11926 [Hypsibius exemplaris]|uniref:Uncharacterized protein n=1 Tax=Hypsibius exemplaris TaxID=2072580 RepID=A0A1W0WF28_HYPEX|nr:hypothetical protein BV898_11926 [Hypsibius exemplaris]
MASTLSRTQILILLAVLTVCAGQTRDTASAGDDAGQNFVEHLRKMSPRPIRPNQQRTTAFPATGIDEGATTATAGPSSSKTITNWVSGKMWWDGAGVCAKEVARNHTTTASLAAAAATRLPRAVDPEEQNVLTLCHINDAGDLRTCRSMRSTNGSAVEVTVTEFKCCLDHQLAGNECIPGNGAVNVTQDTNRGAAATSSSNSPSDPNLLAFFQQILQGSLRTQALISRALNPNSFEMDDEIQPAMMPVVFVSGANSSGSHTSPNLNQTFHVENTEDNSHPDKSEQKTHSDLHLTLIL